MTVAPKLRCLYRFVVHHLLWTTMSSAALLLSLVILCVVYDGSDFISRPSFAAHWVPTN